MSASNPSQHAPASAPIDDVIAALRAQPLDFAGNLDELRAKFEALGGSPRPAAEPRALGDSQALHFSPSGAREPRRGILLFLHAGGYVAGTANGSAALAQNLADATGREVLSVDYPLAPEAPFPAARDAVVDAYTAVLRDHAPNEIALVGASAGGGLAIQALLEIKAMGLPMPGATALLSPFADLTLSGESYGPNAPRDPSLTKPGLEAAARHYAARGDSADPARADLTGLPPTLIHVGSLEILLSDAVDLAGRLGVDDVPVQLQVWSGMVHVFPTFSTKLTEGMQALHSIGEHLDRWLDDGDRS